MYTLQVLLASLAAHWCGSWKTRPRGAVPCLINIFIRSTAFQGPLIGNRYVRLQHQYTPFAAVYYSIYHKECTTKMSHPHPQHLCATITPPPPTTTEVDAAMFYAHLCAHEDAACLFTNIKVIRAEICCYRKVTCHVIIVLNGWLIWQWTECLCYLYWWACVGPCVSDRHQCSVGRIQCLTQFVATYGQTSWYKPPYNNCVHACANANQMGKLEP